MEELLSHPAVQGGAAPFLAGLLVAALGWPLRLAGLAAGAGFLTALILTGNLAFEPLTATRKAAVVGLAACALGAIADLAFKPNRTAGAVLGALLGIASAWVFWSVLSQKPTAHALLYGAGVALFVLVTVFLSATLHGDPIRAGASSLALGLGTGIGSILGASALLGTYGLALGAASGGFLLLPMLLGRRVAAGMSLALGAAAIASLIAAGAMLLAKLPWYSLIALALVPAAVRLPLPGRAHPALQAVAASLYGFVAAGGACAGAWFASRAGS